MSDGTMASRARGDRAAPPAAALARASSPGRGSGDRTLGMRLARAIEQEVISRGWPVGDGLGSEAQLMERYQVGRSVLREAVRILESRWVARPKPGPGGGLVVTAPDPDGVRDATRVYLNYARARPDHLLETWLALEAVAVGELAATIDATGISQLRELVRAGSVSPPGASYGPGAHFHMRIARLAGNPAIELFIRVIVDLVLSAQPAAEGLAIHQWVDPAHEEIVDAIVSGETARAQHHARCCIRRHNDATASGAGGVAGHRYTGPPRTATKTEHAEQ